MYGAYSVIGKRLRKYSTDTYNAVCRAERSAVIILIIIAVAVTFIAFGSVGMYYENLRFASV